MLLFWSLGQYLVVISMVIALFASGKRKFFLQ